MPANAYIDLTDITAKLDIRELAQVSAAPSVTPSSIETDLATELGGGSSGNSDAEAAELIIQAAVDDANSVIDGYLVGAYDLPLAAVPDSLKRHVVRIARYELHDDRATDEIRRRYEEAIRYLEKLAAGTLTLADSTGAIAGQSDTVQISTPAAVFTDRATADGGNTNASDYLGLL